MLIFGICAGLSGCGHVETHQEYYRAEKARYEQQATMQASITQGHVAAYQAAIAYAEKNPLVDMETKEGVRIRVNQPMPLFLGAGAGGGQPVQLTPSEKPRATPGEVIGAQVVETIEHAGLAYFAADLLKTGFKAAANTSVSGSYNQPGGNMSGGSMEIPTTTTTTTTNTETMSGAPIESWE